MELDDAHDPPLRATRPGRIAEIDSQRILWSSEDGARWSELDAQLLPALFACDRFRTDEGHLRELAAAGVPESRARSMIDALARAGILVEPESLLGGAPEPEPDLPPPRIAIRTCRRPDGLRRLLESLVEDERRWGVTRDYLVVDDTPTEGDERVSQAIVRDVARGSASAWHYFGASARNAILPGLCRGFDESTLQTVLQLLDPAHPTAPTGARAWNWCVLLAAGGVVSILDDDTAFPICRSGHPSGPLEIRDALRSSIRAFDALSDLQLEPLDRDPFGYAATVLARSPASLVAERGWSKDSLQDVRNEQVGFVRPRSRVLAAFTGTYGAFAWDTTVHFSSPDRASLDDLLRLPYRHARFNGDLVTYGVPKLRLVARASYTPFLIDARSLLPFAATWGKSDDAFFLSALSAIEPTAVYAYLPVLNGHWPQERRDRIGMSLQPLLHDVNNFAASTLGWFAEGLRSDDRARRLAAAGSACAELAAAGDTELTARVARWRHANLDVALSFNREALALRPDAPAEWRDYVQAMLAVNTHALSDDPFRARPLAAHRDVLQQVGAASAVWPTLWQRATTDAFRAEVEARTALA